MFFDVAELAARLPDAPCIDFPDNGHPLAMKRPEAIGGACLGFT
jgi:hypothetical protein